MALFGRKQAPEEAAAKPDNSGTADPTGAMLLQRQSGSRMIGVEDIRRATQILQKYKAGKANLEERLKQEEQWYKVQHGEIIKSADSSIPVPTSA